jgi:hypothetical protein
MIELCSMCLDQLSKCSKETYRQLQEKQLRFQKPQK